MRRLLKMHHEDFSVHSRLLIVLFMMLFVIAVVVDFAAMLQYVGFVSGLPPILELGATITAATIFPLLGMGMSISRDLNHPK